MNLAISLATTAVMVCSASAQGLYGFSPNDENSTSSSKIDYTAGVRVGFDDLTNPGSAQAEEDSAFITASIAANGVRIDNKNTFDFYLKYAANYHFDEVEGGSNYSNNVYAGVNYTRRINERLRYTSNTHVAYQLEPDYEYGLSNTRTVDEYLTWNSVNVLSLQVNELYSTQFGIRLDGINYGSDRETSNRIGTAGFVQLRYQYSNRTVLTGSYRFRAMNNNSRTDTQSHYLTVGAEHRINDLAVLAVKAGVQRHEVKSADGDDTLTPHIELAYRAKVNERTDIRSYIRYTITDYDTGFNTISYDKNENFRAGLQATRQVTEKLQVNTGADVIVSRRSDSRVFVKGVNQSDELDDEIINAFVGFSYKFDTGVALTGSYNFTHSESDLDHVDYERNRYSLGLEYQW